MRTPFSTLVARALACAALCGAPASARAAEFDFLDETQSVRVLPKSEIEFELGADSRIDRDYRIQGWFSPNVEAILARRGLIEAGPMLLNRGRGVEFGGWKAEARVWLLDPARARVGLAASFEYEVETQHSKHPLFTERQYQAKLVASGNIVPSLLAAVNLGVADQLAPLRRHAFAYGAGVRWPDGRPLAVGLEYSREAIERDSRLVPQAWIRLGDEATLRLGAATSLRPGFYRVIGRAILEVGF